MFQPRMDPFAPVTRSSTPVLVSGEQIQLIHDVLEVSSADSRFMQKAGVAIAIILGAGVNKGEIPKLSSIDPATADAGPITLTLTGAGFVEQSLVFVDGEEVPTTYVSATELTASVDPAIGEHNVMVVTGGVLVTDSQVLTTTEPALP